MAALDGGHAAAVDAWMGRALAGAPAAHVLHAFDAAFQAIWRRANQTLGDVTLTAIGSRVLFYAAERYPLLATLTVDAAGLHGEALRDRAGDLRAPQFADGVRFVLIELLTVLGSLTGEILTTALHEELSKVPP